MVQRLTYRRRFTYNTKSNKRKMQHRGKLVYLHVKKRGKVPKCGDCKCKLFGLKAYRPKKLMKLPKKEKTVQRAYGGSRCFYCVRERQVSCFLILRAFLTEEQKIVVRVLKAQEEKKTASK
ncbi:60S ribosomal protein L34 [Acropora cervicornis]|uniref:Large ribosomal subunit protein eL34 n=1 Tax=Acropora cervicornis TaxID=6130 RepID=A0AAD9QBE8_ACRCE|nr:60S ribosomal protein L34 [Acropora cervicornis]